MTERDDQFYSLGFTTPEQMDEIQEDHPRTHRRPRKMGQVARRSSVHDYESDGDHPEMEDLPAGHVEKPYDGPHFDDPRMAARVIARRELTKSKAQELGGENSIQYRIWFERYSKEHPLLAADQPKGAR